MRTHTHTDVQKLFNGQYMYMYLFVWSFPFSIVCSSVLYCLHYTLQYSFHRQHALKLLSNCMFFFYQIVHLFIRNVRPCLYVTIQYILFVNVLIYEIKIHKEKIVYQLYLWVEQINIENFNQLLRSYFIFINLLKRLHVLHIA